MRVGADDDGVFVRLVDKNGAFCPCFIPDVVTEFVAGVELPGTLVLLVGEAKDVAELVPELVCCVDAVGWVDHLEWGAVGYGVW